ncbi:MAG: winged helix-turn-helix transcriptional regulator [Patescibacteria group bacterium]
MDKRRYKDLERIFKGLANHRRIQIIDIISKEPELSLVELAARLSIDFRTASEHTRKLALGGLIMKRYEAASVRHGLTSRGKEVLKFCRTLE